MTMTYRVSDENRAVVEMGVGYGLNPAAAMRGHEKYVSLVFEDRKVILTVDQARILSQDLLDAARKVSDGLVP